MGKGKTERVGIRLRGVQHHSRSLFWCNGFPQLGDNILQFYKYNFLPSYTLLYQIINVLSKLMKHFGMVKMGHSIWVMAEWMSFKLRYDMTSDLDKF